MKKPKKVKKVSPAVNWATLPQQEFGQWFAEYVTAGLVLKYYARHKKWPTKIKLGNVTVTELEDGSGILSAEMK